MKNLSLSERKQQIIDEMMAAGTGGFTAAAPAEGPVAGFDPVMDKTDKVLRRRKKKKEVKEEIELTDDMILFSPGEIEELAEKLDGKTPKDKDYSLHDWFKGGGWKQTGGKYDGKPCAKQPGQTTKPYCRDADARASMSKEERDKRAAKKRREDPNPDRKGKAKMVTQEGKTYGDFVEEKDACYHKVKASAKVWPSAYASGRLVQCRKKGAANYGKSKKKD